MGQTRAHLDTRKGTILELFPAQSRVVSGKTGCG